MGTYGKSSRKKKSTSVESPKAGNLDGFEKQQGRRMSKLKRSVRPEIRREGRGRVRA